MKFSIRDLLLAHRRCRPGSLVVDRPAQSSPGARGCDLVEDSDGRPGGGPPRYGLGCPVGARIRSALEGYGDLRHRHNALSAQCRQEGPVKLSIRDLLLVTVIAALGWLDSQRLIITQVDASAVHW